MVNDTTHINDRSEIKAEECSDDELDGVVGGGSTMFSPVIPWTCECGTYNAHQRDRNICCHCGKKKP